MKKINFYVDENSYLHRMHPSTKLSLYATWFILANIAVWQTRWMMTLALFLFLWACGVPPWRYKVFLVLTGMASLSAPLLNGFWSYPEDPFLVRFWSNFGLHRNGLQKGLSFSGLYTALGMSTIAWITTTRLWEIAESPTLLGVPHIVGFVVAEVFRYMPEVGMRYLEFMDIQRTRGVSFNKGPIWTKFWLQCRLLATLIILEFTRVRSKSNALEARGFSLKRQQRPTQHILPPIPESERRLIIGTITMTLLLVVSKVVFTIV